MQLKSIELLGFKSFADRTRLEFHQGVVGIVGPNGAGKTNIVDGLRWCLGEQSAKHLRGQEMQDVIFNGTATRPPVGMAHVILTFDNSDGRVPAAYADYTEIQIERRLYRSGESEYCINQIPCRLRDILDLFLGTGVGTKAYSIVEQGRIGQIITAKPEERRFFIEEAAGISKFKNRKEAALRKIEATQINLARLGDIIGELKRQMNALDRQAKRAERYRKLYNALKERELSYASYKYRCLKLGIDSLEKKLEGEGTSETELVAALAREEADLEHARLELTAQEQDLSALQEETYAMQNAIGLHEATMRFSEAKIKNLSEQSKRDAQEVEALKKRSGDLEGELERLNQEKVNQDLARASLAEKVEKLEEDYQMALGQLRGFQEKRDVLTNGILGGVGRLTELTAKLELSERQEIEISGRLAKAGAQIDTIDKKVKELERRTVGAKRDLKDLGQLKLKLAGEAKVVEEELSAKRVQAASAEETLATLREELATIASRLASLEEMRKNLEGYREGVQEILRRVQEGNLDLTGIYGTVGEALEADPPYQKAVSAALGERLQYVVVASHQEGVGAIEYLKEVAKGRSAFIPLKPRHATYESEEISGSGVLGPLLQYVRYADDYKQIIQYLLGDVVLVEDLQKALHIWQEDGVEKTFVTLDGEVVDPAGVVTGGQVGEGEFLLGYSTKVAELRERIGRSKAKVMELEKETQRLSSQITSLEATQKGLAKDSQGEEIRFVHQEKELQHLEAEIARYHQDRDLFTLEMARAHEEKEALFQERAKLAQDLDAASIGQQELEKAKGVLERGLQELSKAAESENQKNLAAKVALAQTEEKASGSENRIQSAIVAKLEAEEAIHKKHLSIGEANGQIQFLKGESEFEKEALSKAVAEFAELSRKQEMIRTALQGELAKIQTKEFEVKEKRRSHEMVISERHQLALKLTTDQSDLKHLIDGIWERYRVDLGAHPADPNFQVADEQALQTDIESMKVDLEKLGSVHVGALEEYEELKSRYDFLSSQQADLANSLASLKKAIQKINRISRERFLESFEKVNQTFQEVFPKLFNGGRARLYLIDEENLLESGVEIFAQPPGKKLTSINLLSGGEKALTAVALIFSIFLIKPSPFCLLDEVDAPLDDANIDRFNDMVRSMTRQSQFILITHNKRTMEKADLLYGVTMEEPGVSKILSVRLEVPGAEDTENRLLANA